MGVTRLTVYDHDVVSIENMSNQFFRFMDIGKNKAHALASLIKDFTGVTIKENTRKFEEKDVQSTSGILIVAVDSMEARQWIANEVKRIGFGVRLVIDPRMGAEHYTQYTMNVFNEKDAETYKKTMYSDSEAVQERCTAKSTVYTATLAAGLITKTLKNYILDEDYPRSIQWDIKSAENTSMQMFAGNVAAPSL